ncbi:MAG TPA: GyrI-like domain-containing protein [Candidatus Limnocylindria bacterium]|nr:GyrI-like domain-containing protein [Candidatus Limnocylindria bacterium]
MPYDITVADVATRKVLSKRAEVPIDAIGPTVQGALREIYEYLARSSGAPTGEPFVIYHSRPTMTAGWQIEVCAPISRDLPAPPGWSVREVPGGSVATTLHVGPYQSLGLAYEEIERFIRTHELDVAGPPREIYLSGPEVPASETKTRIEFPVSRVPLVVRG